MGIFRKLSDLFKSNANAALDKATDPAKEMELLVVQMEQEIRNARAEVVQTMGAQKIAAARVEKLGREVQTWRDRAAEAARAGSTELAAEAEQRRADLEKELAAMRDEARIAAEAAAAQQAALPRLEARLRQMKAKKGTIHAKIALNQNQGARVDALEDFARIGDKVESDEATQGAYAEVEDALHGEAKETQLARKIDALSTKDGDVAQRLAALKAQASKDKKET